MAHASSTNVRSIFQVRVKAAAAFRVGAEKVGSLQYRVATLKFNLEHGLCSEEDARKVVGLIHRELNHVYEKFQDLGERMGDLQDRSDIVLQDIADLTESIAELSASVFAEGLFIRQQQAKLQAQVEQLRDGGSATSGGGRLPQLVRWCGSGSRPSIEQECSSIEEQLLERRADALQCKEFRAAWDSCGDHLQKVERAYSAISASEGVVCECVGGVAQALREACDCTTSLGFLSFALEALELLGGALEEGSRKMPMPKVHMHMLGDADNASFFLQ
jgi:uncharacterized coiled-coil protein SlyX